MKPAFAEATAGRGEDELYKMAKTMLGLPDTSIEGLHRRRAGGGTPITGRAIRSWQRLTC